MILRRKLNNSLALETLGTPAAPRQQSCLINHYDTKEQVAQLLSIIGKIIKAFIPQDNLWAKEQSLVL